MSDQVSSDEKQTKSTERYPFFEMARKVMLASIGAFALAQDELEEFVNHLIERGELAEKEGKQLISEMREKRKARYEKAEAEIKKWLEKALAHTNLASKADVEALSKKVAELSKKIDRLTKTE